MNVNFKKLVLIGVLLICGVLAGCNTTQVSEEDVVAVRKVLAERAAAIEARDINRYQALFLSDYFDGKYKLEDVVSDMQSVFEKHKTVKLVMQKSPVNVTMNSARVIQRVVYEVDGVDKPIHGHETLLLRRIDGVWKISGGVELGLL